MADLTVTAAQVATVFPTKADVVSYVSAAALTAGQPVYVNTSGKAGVADANGAAPINTFRGIALETVGAGQPVSVLRRGELYGFDLSALAFDAAVYVSDTAGSLADAAGTASLRVGRVQPLADASTVNKVLFVEGWA